MMATTELDLLRQANIKNEGLRATIRKLTADLDDICDRRRRALACIRLQSLSAEQRLNLVAKTLVTGQVKR